MATTIFSTRMLEFRGGKLIALGAEQAAEITIGPEPVVVGRDPACQLVVDETGISSMHAELIATPRGVRLRDLGSRRCAPQFGEESVRRRPQLKVLSIHATRFSRDGRRVQVGESA